MTEAFLNGENRNMPSAWLAKDPTNVNSNYIWEIRTTAGAQTAISEGDFLVAIAEERLKTIELVV